MATVTVFTAARMQEIENASIVDGDVVGDDLILTRYDTTTINAGDVRGPQGIQGNVGPAGPTSIVVCTSSTRPTGGALFEGLFIYETDTDRVYSYNGTTWVSRGTTHICTRATRPTGAALFEGLYIYETDTDQTFVYNGSAWVYAGGVVLCTSSTRPTGSALFEGLVIYETDTDKRLTYNDTIWTTPKNQAGGILATPVTRTTDAGPVTTEADLSGLTISLPSTFPGSRHVRVAFMFRAINGSVLADVFAVRIKEGATILQEYQLPIVAAPSAGKVSSGGMLEAWLTPTAGAHTYKISLLRLDGTGDATLKASSNYPATLTVTDMGGV